jgi:chromosome segregation ATPase
MGKTITFGVCACECGKAITHEGSTYAGADEQERNRHRAKAAYRRKSGDKGPAGTREAMAALGLADDVPVSELADRMAAVAGELARRVAGVDSASIAREIERGLSQARDQVEAAEKRQAEAEARAMAAGDELAAAVDRADQADADAVKTGDKVEQLVKERAAYEIERAGLMSKLRNAKDEQVQAERRADRAEALLAEVRAEAERALTDLRARSDAETAVKLADLRAELTEQLGEMRTQLALVTAERDGLRERTERAEARISTRTRKPATATAVVAKPTEAAKPRTNEGEK